MLARPPQLKKFGGLADLSAGTYGLFRERLSLNLPVGDTVAIRRSVQRLDHEGFTRDAYYSHFREDDAHNTSTKLAIM